MDNLSSKGIAKAFAQALQSGLVRREDSAVIFYDLSFLEQRIHELKNLFPPDTLHGLAVKACPLSGIMKATKALGCGVEAASLGEVMLALKLGFDPGMIVYDSPVKTQEELEFALREGIHLNLDNFSELERVKERLVKSEERSAISEERSAISEERLAKSEERSAKSSIGIRINPQVGEGTILESSVAGEYSKFGVPLKFKRQELIDAFLEHDFLRGMHLHVGSQGCSLEMLVEGTGKLYDLMLEINGLSLAKKGFPQIRIFDIGGGLPVSYSRDQQPVSMKKYVSALRKRAPLLFPSDSGQSPPHPAVRLITEFGRWTYTNAGWTISRVEYVKHDPSVNTAMIHVGADLFLRECLNPRDWKHEYTVLDKEGRIRTGVSDNPWNLAGPLCFSGDILAKGVTLPSVEEGDYIVIHDTGSYTFSMWSRYNSRFAPRILGYHNGGKSFELIRERENIEDILRFWT
jgi:diaminopimelate decarboxylase